MMLIATARLVADDLLPPTVSVRTERMGIRRLDRGDAPAYETSLDDVMIQANGWTSSIREAQIAAVRSSAALGRQNTLVAVDSTTAEPVAFVSVSNTDPTGQWSVGIWVSPVSRGKGFALEALMGAAASRGASARARKDGLLVPAH